MTLPKTPLKVVGMDPSLRNWGLAGGIFDLDTWKLELKGMTVLRPVLPEGKDVRQNSSDLVAASTLYREAFDLTEGAHAVFVEVPVGSQSARAMASYAICIGVLGALMKHRPIYQLNPTEVKVVATGKGTATKREMIQWAMKQHPAAPWPTHITNGKTVVTESTAEHMADAVAAIHAGVVSSQFTQTMALMGHKRS